MPAREINPFTALRPGFDPNFSGYNDRRAITASEHDYALDHSAIGADGGTVELPGIPYQPCSPPY